MKFDPAYGPDFETAKKNIKIGKVLYSIIGVTTAIISAKSFANLGGVIQGERFVESMSKALDEVKEN